jgi:hypothetical protein
MESILMMSRMTFDYICSLVTKDLTTKTYGFRNFRFGDKTILGVEDQVAVALMRLTSGESLQNIGMWFGMNHSAISNITWRFIESMEERAICHLKWPSPEEIATIKARFEKIYGLPNCCGAIDTTHILMCLNQTAESGWTKRTKTAWSCRLLSMLTCDSETLSVAGLGACMTHASCARRASTGYVRKASGWTSKWSFLDGQ